MGDKINTEGFLNEHDLQKRRKIFLVVNPDRIEKLSLTNNLKHCCNNFIWKCQIVVINLYEKCDSTYSIGRSLLNCSLILNSYFAYSSVNNETAEISCLFDCLVIFWNFLSQNTKISHFHENSCTTVSKFEILLLHVNKVVDVALLSVVPVAL